MKVPRINVGVNVNAGVTRNDPYLYESTITEVDHVGKTFHIDRCSWYPYSMERYDPAPTVNNFMRAIGEWDYHYRASDDSRIYNEGKEYEQALIKLFRALPQEDQHNMRKIADIVTLSVLPKT